jgi:hypothetical protein
MSSRYTKAKGRLPSKESMRCWKVFPTFRRPKGMRRNSNNPKEVMTPRLGDIGGGNWNLKIPLAKI